MLCFACVSVVLDPLELDGCHRVLGTPLQEQHVFFILTVFSPAGLTPTVPPNKFQITSLKAVDPGLQPCLPA